MHKYVYVYIYIVISINARSQKWVVHYKNPLNIDDFGAASKVHLSQVVVLANDVFLGLPLQRLRPWRQGRKFVGLSFIIDGILVNH